MGEETLSGYKLDVDTLEELNFYLDRVTPILKDAGHLPGHRFILIPEKVYRDLQARGHDFLHLIREFHYKAERLFLISTMD